MRRSPRTQGPPWAGPTVAAAILVSTQAAAAGNLAGSAVGSNFDVAGRRISGRPPATRPETSSRALITREPAGTDEAAWIRLSPVGAAPTPRQDARAIFDPVRDRLVVFGGDDETGLSNDTWALSLTGTLTWMELRPVGPLPPARYRHAAVYDPVRDRMVVMGGVTDDGGYHPLNDVWALYFSGAPTWLQLSPTGAPPPERDSHTGVYDPARDRMLVYGGWGGTGSLGDVWALDMAGHPEASPEWSLLSVGGSPPAARVAHAAILDPVRDQMVVFGGGIEAPEPWVNDTWTLTLPGSPAWTQIVTGARPEPRAGHAAVYDPARERMLVFGGFRVVGDTLPDWRNDTWVLSLTGAPEWSPLVPVVGLPPRRSVHTVVYDPVRDRMLLFGGNGPDGFLNDVWALVLGGLVAAGEQDVARTHLSAPHPMPSRGSVTWVLEMREEGPVRAVVYDAGGRQVRGLPEGARGPGRHRIHWNGISDRGVTAPSGYYVLQVWAEGRRLSRGVVLLR